MHHMSLSLAEFFVLLWHERILPRYGLLHWCGFHPMVTHNVGQHVLLNVGGSRRCFLAVQRSSVWWCSRCLRQCIGDCCWRLPDSKQQCVRSSRALLERQQQHHTTAGGACQQHRAREWSRRASYQISAGALYTMCHGNLIPQSLVQLLACDMSGKSSPKAACFGSRNFGINCRL